MNVTLLLASCGGDDGESTDTAATSQGAGADYVSAGNAACAAATAELLELGPDMAGFFETDTYPPGTLEPYGPTASAMADILESLASELSELEPPGDRELIAGQLVSYLEGEAAALREVQEAAESGSELDQRVETNLSIDHVTRVGIAESVGLGECAVRVLG